MTTFSRIVSVVAALGVVIGLAGPASAANEAGVTYHKDVLPIVQENCQTCHRPSGHNISGLVAPMSFMTYEETRPWARAIARKVESREMPPWFASEPKGVFENERGLTDAEIDTILTWVEAGAPAGDRGRCAAGAGLGRKTCMTAGPTARPTSSCAWKSRSWCRTTPSTSTSRSTSGSRRTWCRRTSGCAAGSCGPAPRARACITCARSCGPRTARSSPVRTSRRWPWAAC